MAYTKTTWTDGSTPLSADNMNHIENGIKDNEDAILSLASDVYTKGDAYSKADIVFKTITRTFSLQRSSSVTLALGSDIIGLDLDDYRLAALAGLQVTDGVHSIARDTLVTEWYQKNELPDGQRVHVSVINQIAVDKTVTLTLDFLFIRTGE